MTAARERELADVTDKRRVVRAGDSRHPCEAGVRSDVRVGVDLEDPRLAIRVDAHVHTSIAASPDELPGAQRNASNLIRDLRRQTCGAPRCRAEVVDAARLPFRLIGNDTPPPA